MWLRPEQLIGELLFLSQVHRPYAHDGANEDIARDPAHTSASPRSAGIKGISPFS